MNKKSSDLLKLGVGLLIIGVLLGYYSFVSYIDFRTLGVQVDFDSVDNNVQMPDSDKYYKYLSYADFLNKKLDKNKNLIIKNESCAYIDYAHHNAVALYSLTDKKMSEKTKKEAAVGVVQELYDRLNYYSTCKNYKTYKDDLHAILDNKDYESESIKNERMKMFLNSEPEQGAGAINREEEGIIRVDDIENSDNNSNDLREYTEENSTTKEMKSVKSTKNNETTFEKNDLPKREDLPEIRY